MSTIANRLREIAVDVGESGAMTAYVKLRAIATELEAAPAAEPALWMTPDQTAWAHEQGAHGRGRACTETYYSASTVAALQAHIASLRAQARHAEDVVEAAKHRIAELEARRVPDDALGKLIDIAAHHFTEGRYGWPSKWTHEKMIQHWRDGKPPVPDVFAPSNPTTQPPEGR